LTFKENIPKKFRELPKTIQGIPENTVFRIIPKKIRLSKKCTKLSKILRKQYKIAEIIQ
jgi:hypothetical protein